MSKKLVLTFYYAWYGTPWGPAGKWLGWNSNNYNPDIIVKGERQIATTNYPLDGVYDSCDPFTLRRHISQAQESSIDGFMVSWWGFESYSHKSLEELLKLSPKNFVTIYYETLMTANLKERNRMNAVKKIFSDLKRILEKYSRNPSWIRVDGKPLLVIYATEEYKVEEWKYIKGKLQEEGLDPFILGDTYNVSYLDVFDGLHTYNPIWITKRGLGFSNVYRTKAREAKRKGKLFAATVTPGYDDRKIRRPGTYIPREGGRYYRKVWEAAIGSGADWILITSWNEWFEGTEIEPSVEYGYDFLYLTSMYSGIFKSTK
ncbi:MAG: hypothetical protein DRJ51_02185 [Thermoprotei archaeon]|nr:MAG: hypothetical protein DRJ51_02185 [Thermoprotei archaeon]